MVVPAFLSLSASPLAPREGAASGSPAAVSASFIACDNGTPAALPVESSTMMVVSPLRSVWLKHQSRAELADRSGAETLVVGGQHGGVLIDEIAGEMRVDIAQDRIAFDERRHAAGGARYRIA